MSTLRARRAHPARGTPRAEADVCVVGAGPAGLTLATALARAGRSVLLLESGGRTPSAEGQELAVGDVVGEEYAGLAATRRRALGGTAHAWNVDVRGALGAKYVPLSARDMRDWPIAREDLDRYYGDAQALCGLGAFAYDGASWATAERRPFPLEGTGLTSGVYQFGRAQRFTSEIPAGVTASELVDLRLASTVVRLEGNRRGGVVAVAVDADARPCPTGARVVVLACGAVEAARLLLLSGLGGRWAGRCFMEHARDFSLVLAPADRDVVASAGYYDAWEGWDGTTVGGYIAPTEAACDALGLPSAALTLVPRAAGWRTHATARIPARLGGLLGLPPRARYGWSRVRSPRHAFDRVDIVLNLEQRPDAENRVSLGQQRDRFGTPLPRLVLRWAVEDQAGLERLRHHLAAGLSDAGIGRLQPRDARRVDLSAHHHAGTARMATDGHDGVVDSNGRVFGTDNLYVAGAAVFPRAGFANPMLTVIALALRLADHLDEIL